MKKKLVLACLVVGGLFWWGGLEAVVRAETSDTGAPDSKTVWGTVEAPSGLATQYGKDVGTGIVTFVNYGLAFLTGIAAIWFLVTIIVSGIKIIQSAKSPEDFYTHMKKIMWAAAGMVLVALAYVITSWVLTKLFGDASLLDDPVKSLPTPTTTTTTTTGS